MQAPVLKISYVLSIFPSSEMKLAKSKREAIGRVLELTSTEPWDTVKAQILHTLESALSPPTINMHDYEISYTIPSLYISDLSHDETKGIPHVRDYMHFLLHFFLLQAWQNDKNKENDEGGVDADEPKNKKSKSNVSLHSYTYIHGLILL